MTLDRLKVIKSKGVDNELIIRSRNLIIEGMRQCKKLVEAAKYIVKGLTYEEEGCGKWVVSVRPGCAVGITVCESSRKKIEISFEKDKLMYLVDI